MCVYVNRSVNVDVSENWLRKKREEEDFGLNNKIFWDETALRTILTKGSEDESCVVKDKAVFYSRLLRLNVRVACHIFSRLNLSFYTFEICLWI